MGLGRHATSWKRHMIDFRRERSEALLVGRDLCREGHAQKRAAMECRAKGDHGAATGGSSRDLDSVFDRFDASGHKQCLLGATDGSLSTRRSASRT